MKTKILLLSLAIAGIIITACVKDEIFQGPPLISNLVLNPQTPIASQPVGVSITVTDMNGVQSVTLYYKVGEGTYSTVDMPETSTENVYAGQIPGQESGVTVSYYIEALNTVGKKSYHPAGAPTTTASYTVGAPSILMNEIYSRGTTEAPDWIEIYNNSDVTVDISGYKIYDSGAQSGGKPKKEFPSGTILSARGFTVIVVDDGTTDGFGLSSGGDEIWFENTTGSIIDNVVIPAMPDITTSYGRMPDGSSNWQILTTITQGAANDNSPAPVIKINEIYSRGTTESPDWIEVYNTSSTSVDITGFKVYDSGGQSGSKPKKAFPSGSVVPANGFLVIVVDTEDESGFGLSSGGEQVWLENAGGTVIDDQTFPALEENTSYGRFPDGTTNWQVLYVATPGAANDDSPATSPIVLNEVYSRGTVDAPDWIEVYNTSGSEVDISGFKVYDSGGQTGAKPKKVFPSGSTIPANGFLVIVVDTEDESGFGISSGGEEVWLESASGTPIDSVEVPALDENTSMGRFPDGTANWQVLFVVTPGAANDDSPAPAPIKLNEAYSRGITEFPDWVEIFNASDADVDISGYKIYDSGGQAGTKPKKVFPEGSLITANGFLVIVVDDEDESGFGLSSGGDEIWLEDVEGNIVDHVVIPALATTQSYGRYPDGGDDWAVLNLVTPAAANDNSTPSPITINEVFSRGTAEDPDWIEVHNSSSSEVNISGYKIYDGGGQSGSKPKKLFPENSIVPAGGFLVIVVDDADASGFGLSSSGEQVWLEDAGGTVINTVTFPALDVTQSYGRMPDGTYNLQILNTITKGAANAL